jgi:hypothetical protein
LTASELISALQQLDSSELSSVITAGVSILAARSNGKPHDEPDELLDVSECAQRIGKSKSWVYHHGRALPFCVLGLGGVPRFSAKGLEKYVSERSGVNR